MSRKQCLEVLKRLLEAMETFDGISPSPERINALKIAISSLETDEAYQLEYENRDCLEVVRCKDCIHYKGNSCEWHNGFMPPENWFCADSRNGE